MSVELDEESEQKITRFIKSLSANIANKVDLHCYLSFHYVCNLARKVENQLKGRKNPSISPLLDCPLVTLKLKPTPNKSKLLTSIRESLVNHLTHIFGDMVWTFSS